jgi:uncharacterized protein YybS (DUF2232 family)
MMAIKNKELVMDERWHLSKSISLVHLITTISVLTATIWYFATTDNRITLVEKDQVYLRATVQRVEEQQKEQGKELSNQINALRNETNSNFDKIDKKLDKIIDRALAK